jgi:hypothetical protein
VSAWLPPDCLKVAVIPPPAARRGWQRELADHHDAGGHLSEPSCQLILENKLADSSLASQTVAAYASAVCSIVAKAVSTACGTCQKSDADDKEHEQIFDTGSKSIGRLRRNVPEV